jgi:hypothetical protein
MVQFAILHENAHIFDRFYALPAHLLYRLLRSAVDLDPIFLPFSVPQLEQDAAMLSLIPSSNDS